MKRITIASVKSFIKKHKSDLCTVRLTDYDGYREGTYPTKDHLHPVEWSGDFETDPYTLGIPGVWVVGHARDHFVEWESEEFTGYKYSNTCGSGVIATRK